MGEVKVTRYEERTTRLVFKGPTDVLSEIEEVLEHPFGPSVPIAACSPTGDEELTCHAHPGTAEDVLKSAGRVATIIVEEGDEEKGEVEPPKFRVFYEGASDSPYLCDFEESETKYFDEQPDAESYAEKLVSDLLRVAAKESDDVDKVLIRDARDGKLIGGWMTEEGKVVKMVVR